MPAVCIRFGLVLSLSGWLAACAVTAVDGRRLRPGSDAFGDYVEAVFRRQNQVATELTLALDAADPESPDYALLEDAELQLLTRCRGLNQLANERRDGEPVGGLGALQRARQAPDCELATRDAVALLERS